MTLFLILTVPCAGILYVRLVYERSFYTDEVRSSLLFGVAAHIIAVVPLLMVHTQVPFSYTPSSLYIYAWVKDFLIYWILGFLLLVLMRRKVFKLFTERERWAESASFWVGFLMPMGIYWAIINYPAYTPYRLFLFPVLMLLLLWVSAAASFLLYNSEKMVTKILAPAAATLFTLVPAAVPYLFSVNYDVWAYVLFVFVSVVAAAVIYITERFFPGFHKIHTHGKIPLETISSEADDSYTSEPNSSGSSFDPPESDSH
ncbi:MAG: hypothetical protein R6V67_08730 [Spirochaetia bacterium]